MVAAGGCSFGHKSIGQLETGAELAKIRRFRNFTLTIVNSMNKAVGVFLALAWAVSAQAQQAPVQGKADAGKNKVSMCIGCHGIPGYKATFPEVYYVPKVAGQNAAYLENALKAYRQGERNHPTMTGIAATLSDQDIADLAAYYAATR